MKSAVITGATSGIGLAVAKGLAKRDTAVIGIGRSEEKCEAAVKEIMLDAPGAQVKYFCGDLSKQADVNRVGEQIGQYLDKECGAKLDALINNVGGFAAWYTTTPEGYETQFALNHLAGFALTHAMMSYLEAAKGRMMLTGSGSHKHMKIRWKDIMFSKRYSCLMAYKQSKLCNMLFASEFNRRFIGRGVRAYVVDPGLVNTDIGSKGTAGLISWFWDKRKKYGVAPEVAAQTYEYLCKKEPTPQGLYYYLCRESKYSRHADNKEDAKRLFDLSEQLCGVVYEGSETA